MSKPAERQKYAAYHVGRFGEVAGGMTQVVNEYLAWDFADWQTIGIRSRSGKSIARDLCLTVIAALRVIFCDRRRPGVFVVHLSQGGSFYREGLLILLAVARGWPVIAQLHGSRFEQFASRRRRLVRFILSAADAVMTLSQSTYDLLVRILPPSVPVTRIPNAVSPGVPGPKQHVVVFGGAVGRRKGVDVLLRAWEGVSEVNGWQLRILGPIEDPEVVREVAGVTFVGPAAHDDLLSELETAAIAVLPSRNEAMPMFLLEAMARGCCIVSTSVGGIRDLVGDEGGIIVPPDDVEALAGALASLLNDDRLRVLLGQAATRRFDDTFSARVVFPKVEALWTAVLDGSFAK